MLVAIRRRTPLQVATFESDKAASIARIDAAIARLVSFEKLLFQCQSCTAVDIREREARKTQQQVTELIDRQAEALLASVQATCAKIATATSECAPEHCSPLQQRAALHELHGLRADAVAAATAATDRTNCSLGMDTFVHRVLQVQERDVEDL